MDNSGYRILIADRNPNIRSFLKRELMAAGHVIHLAGTGSHLIQILYGSTNPDILIIDPDFPDIEFSVLITKLQDRVPPLPVVVHSLDMDMISKLPSRWRDTVVEKNGGSVEVLKSMIPQALALDPFQKKDPENAPSSPAETENQKPDHHQ